MFKSSSDAAWQVPVCLLLILFGLALYTRSETPQPAPETIEVLVAAKDLQVGTVLTKTDFANLVTRKAVPKDSLPPQYVTNEAELIGKRLTRPLKHDEPFDPANMVSPVKTGGFPPPMDLYKLGFAKSGVTDQVTPGSRVDIVASHQRGDQRDVFVLLENMHVVAVGTWENPHSFGSPVPMLTFAVDQTQAVLLSLAEKRGCELKVQPRTGDKPLTLTQDDHAKRIQYFRGARVEAQREVAPAPRVRAWGTLTLPEGMDIMSLPLPEGGGAAAGFIVPGSRVDVIATLKRGGKVEAFALVDDALVLAVDTVLVYQPEEKMKHTISLAVDRDTALLLSAAIRRECKMNVILRAPGKPATTTADEYKKRLKLLQELREVAPAPRAKGSDQNARVREGRGFPPSPLAGEGSPGCASVVGG